MSLTLMPRARARVALAGLSTAIVVAAAGCGSSTSGNSNADPATVTPSSAPLYASLVVKPEGDQRTQLEAVLKKVMRTDNPGAKIVQLFDKSAKKDGVTYEKDVKPWLGKRAGVFLTSITANATKPDYAVVLPASDTGAGLKSVRKGDKGVQKRSYHGVDYQVNDKGDASAAVKDFVVVGTEPALKQAIDTSKDSGRSITKDADYTKASSEAGSDSLATFFIDPNALFDAFARSGSVNAQGVTAIKQALSSAGVRAVAMGADAQASGFQATFASIGSKSSSVDPGDGPGALAAVPGDSWLGIGIGNLGGRLQDALKQIGQAGAFAGVNLDQLIQQLKQQSGIDLQADLLDWMGDAALFVRGTSVGDIGGGLIVHSKDPSATQRGVARIAKLLRRSGQTVTRATGKGVDTGISFKIKNSLDVFLVSAGDKFVAAVGRPALDAALSGSQTLGDSPGFQQASSQLGDGLRPAVFFAMDPVLQLVDSVGSASTGSFQKAEPYLKAFTTIVAGAKRSGDVSKGRIVVGVK